MRHLFWLLPAVLIAGPAYAVGQYDGVYSGAIQPTPGMSNPACTAFPVSSVNVKDGDFRYDAPTLNGNVNIKGFVTGKMATPDNRQLEFQGRASETDSGSLHITAGIIDNQSSCEWTMDLKRQ